MFDMVSEIKRVIDNHLDNDSAGHVFIAAFDHRAGREILYRSLHDVVRDTRVETVLLDGDVCCWSPERFLRSWERSLQYEQLLTGQGTSRCHDVVPVTPPGKNGGDEIGQKTIASVGELFAAIAERIKRRIERNRKNIFIVFRRLNAMNILSHYRGFETSFESFQHMLIEELPAVTCIFEGKPPGRKEHAYEQFLRGIAASIVEPGPIGDEELQDYYNSRAIPASAAMRSFILDLTGGVFGGVEILDTACRLWTPIGEGAFDKSFALLTIDRLLKDPTDALSLYCSQRFNVAMAEAKGMGGIRSLIHILAYNDSMSLGEIARCVDRSPAAVKDYLDSLREVGLVTKSGRVYRCADPLVARWLRLNEDSFQEHVRRDGRVSTTVTDNDQTPLKRNPRSIKKRDDAFVEFD